MKIGDLAFKDGTAGSNGAWHATTIGNVRRVWHYSTLMLSIVLDQDGEPVTIGVESLGHGTVSDQGGCNRIFNALGPHVAPYYYSRAGGSEVVNYKTGQAVLSSNAGIYWGAGMFGMQEPSRMTGNR